MHITALADITSGAAKYRPFHGAACRRPLSTDGQGLGGVRDRRQSPLRETGPTVHLPSYVEWLTCLEMETAVKKIREEQNTPATPTQRQR
jgi:hypothetical protein